MSASIKTTKKKKEETSNRNVYPSHFLAVTGVINIILHFYYFVTVFDESSGKKIDVK